MSATSSQITPSRTANVKSPTAKMAFATSAAAALGWSPGIELLPGAFQIIAKLCQSASPNWSPNSSLSSTPRAHGAPIATQ